MATVLPTPESPSPRRSAYADGGGRVAGIAGAIVFHAVVIALLLQHEPVRRTLRAAAPIIVSLIAEEHKPPPKVQAAKVKAQHAPAPVDPVVPPPPVVASRAPSELSITLTPAAEESLRAAEPVDAIEAPAPAPVIPPRFDAEYLRNPAPVYPALSRRIREQGRVMLRVLVSVDGIAERVELKASSGSARLDQSALETVRQWKFVPARQGDRAIAAWVVVPITFTLDG
jgi:protein TonB